MLLVDGHVHFHPCFTWGTFLEAAARNFARARSRRGLSPSTPGCLMFTESAGANYFWSLTRPSTLAGVRGWRVESGDDGRSVRLTDARDGSIIVITGRQIVTAERLEVLALGCAREFPDGQPIMDTLRAVADHDAVPVIPWGFGKWLGHRGRVIRSLLECRYVPFCLGDNGGRARILRRPPLFDHAERQCVTVLGGSDPLPLPGHVRRAGSYGFVLDGWRSTSRPAPAITTRIRALTQSPAAFGELSSAAFMLESQLRLRWPRRIGGMRASMHPAAVAESDGE